MHKIHWIEPKKTLITALALILTLPLTGCGGGGGGGDGVSTSSTGGYTPSPSSGSGSPTPVTTSTAKLTWGSPTRNVDGSCAADISTYRISYGTASRAYSKSVDISLTHDNVFCQQVDYDTACNAIVYSCSYVVSDLTPGTWYFAMQAIDAKNNQSSYSNEASKTISN